MWCRAVLFMGGNVQCHQCWHCIPFASLVILPVLCRCCAVLDLLWLEFPALLFVGFSSFAVCYFCIVPCSAAACGTGFSLCYFCVVPCCVAGCGTGFSPFCVVLFCIAAMLCCAVWCCAADGG